MNFGPCYYRILLYLVILGMNDFVFLFVDERRQTSVDSAARRAPPGTAGSAQFAIVRLTGPGHISSGPQRKGILRTRLLRRNVKSLQTWFWLYMRHWRNAECAETGNLVRFGSPPRKCLSRFNRTATGLQSLELVLCELLTSFKK